MRGIIFILTISLVATAHARFMCQKVVTDQCMIKNEKLRGTFEAMFINLMDLQSAMETPLQDFFNFARTALSVETSPEEKKKSLKALESNVLSNSEMQNYHNKLREYVAKVGESLAVLNDINNLTNANGEQCIDVSEEINSQQAFFFSTIQNINAVLEYATYV
jgi:hypothetical protein